MSTTQRVPDYPPSDKPHARGSVASSAYAEPRGGDPEHPLGVIQPIVRRWWLVVLCVALLTGGGVYAALQQAPTYTATAQLNVGRTDVRVAALPGYVAGATSLATAYSRITASEEIQDPLARRLNLSRKEVRSRLTAVPVPGSPIFNVQGKGDSEADAISFTVSAMREVERYVKRTDAGTDSPDDLLADFRRYTQRASSLRREVGQLERRRSRILDGSADGTAPSLARIDRLQAQYETAQLRASTLQSQYQNRADEVSSTAGVQVISRPTAAVSNQRQLVQRAAVAGIAGGLLIGGALALLLGRRSRRKLAR